MANAMRTDDPLSTDAKPAPHPVTLARHAQVVAPPAREPAELSAHGLTWVHLDSPTSEEAMALAERFGWHPLDVEDVLSKRQRPKVDEYDDYRFIVLHFCGLRQIRSAPERRRARRFLGLTTS